MNTQSRNDFPVLEDYPDPQGKKVGFECPGCKALHTVYITANKGEKVPVWNFNDSYTKPTLKPSILVRSTSIPQPIPEDEDGNIITGNDGRIKGAKDEICHSFVTDGMIQFLNDCTHELKGNTVPLKQVIM